MEGPLLLLVYALVGALVIGLGILLYLRSAASRQTYTCAQCGESLTVELMRATHCNTCGAPLGRPNG